MATVLSTPRQQASWRDYVELTKPKVVLLMLITSLVGMFLATRAGVPWTVLLFGNLGIGLCAGAAAAVNHVVDRRIDGLMARTHKRPLADGRIAPMAALAFALLLAVLGMSVLLVFTNALTAWLTLASLLGYAVLYTGFLKRATPQNIVIGGLAGAAPPLLGWVAVTGQITAEPLLLVLIIFAWTPPHFWALAIFRRDDYARAMVPMLPVSHGVEYTRWQILFYTVLLVIATMLPFIVGMSGVFYLGGAAVLGVVFLGYAIRLMRPPSELCAMQVFGYSIWYLMALFAFLLIDHWLMPAAPAASANALEFLRLP